MSRAVSTYLSQRCAEKKLAAGMPRTWRDIKVDSSSCSRRRNFDRVPFPRHGSLKLKTWK